MSDVYQTAHNELAIETEQGEYRVVYLSNHNIALLPPDLWTNTEIKSALTSSSLVQDIENHEAVSAIRRP